MSDNCGIWESPVLVSIPRTAWVMEPVRQSHMMCPTRGFPLVYIGMKSSKSLRKERRDFIVASCPFTSCSLPWWVGLASWESALFLPCSHCGETLLQNALSNPAFSSLSPQRLLSNSSSFSQRAPGPLPLQQPPSSMLHPHSTSGIPRHSAALLRNLLPCVAASSSNSSSSMGSLGLNVSPKLRAREDLEK